MTVRRMLPSKRSLGSASSSIAISQSKSGLGFIDKNWETETSIDWFIDRVSERVIGCAIVCLIAIFCFVLLGYWLIND